VYTHTHAQQAHLETSGGGREGQDGAGERGKLSPGAVRLKVP
jgi:hypothetical protein